MNDIQAGGKLWWNHTQKHRFGDLDPSDPRLKKQVNVKSIHQDIIRTDFGSYQMENGKNVDIPCGCKRFCDCYGSLDLSQVL